MFKTVYFLSIYKNNTHIKLDVGRFEKQPKWIRTFESIQFSMSCDRDEVFLKGRLTLIPFHPLYRFREVSQRIFHKKENQRKVCKANKYKLFLSIIAKVNCVLCSYVYSHRYKLSFYHRLFYILPLNHTQIAKKIIRIS